MMGFPKRKLLNPLWLKKNFFFAKIFIVDNIILKDGIFFTPLIKFNGSFRIRPDKKLLLLIV